MEQNHQCMLKQVGESLIRNKIHSLKISLHKLFIDFKVEQTNFTVERNG